MTSPLAARVDADCAEAGMEAGYPLREILVTVAKAADDTRAAAEKIGKEAAKRAASAAADEARSQLAKAARAITWLRGAALAGLLVVSGGLGYFVGQRTPQPTTLGRLTPVQMESVRWNDVGSLLATCARQPARDGREWCAFTQGWWLSPPSGPK